MFKKSTLALSAVGAKAGLLMTAATAFAQEISVTEGELPKVFNTFKEPGVLIANLISIAFIIAVILVFFYLIWGGIEWITSGGDKGKTESARNKITAAVIGLIVLAASYAILTLVLNLLGYTDLNDALTPKDAGGGARTPTLDSGNGTLSE